MATSASLDIPQAVTVDTAGNVYIAEARAGKVRKIDKNTGIISTFAGNNTPGAGGDGKFCIN